MLTAEEQETVSIFDRSTPGVVFITNQVYKIEDYASREVKEVPQGTGSGWVFDMDGHIVTNFHVVQGSNSLLVKFIEGTEVPAKVVGADPGSDVAVLKVDLPPARAKKLLKPLSVGKSAGLKVGQEVFAIGNPFGLDHTLTKGIVSGVARTIKSVSDRPISGAIQTDASINPGNSGGPLISSRGQVVGMNTVIFSPSGASAGVGFAIPSDTVAARVASIIQYGYVKRPSLGIYLGQDGLAQRLTGRKDGGVFIAGLRPGDAAQQGGVLPGDIIIQLDKRRTKGVNDIFAEIDEHQPGDQLDIKLLRTEDPRAALEGEPSTYREYTAKVTLTEAPLTSDR